MELKNYQKTTVSIIKQYLERPLKNKQNSPKLYYSSNAVRSLNLIVLADARTINYFFNGLLELLDLYSEEVLTFGNAFDIFKIAKNTRPVFARIHGGFYNTRKAYNTYFRRENDQ